MTPRRSHRLGAFLALTILGAPIWVTARAGEPGRRATETTGGWVKSSKNPVLGGDLGF